MTRDLAGLGELLRLAWRRDRILIPVSVLALITIAVTSAKATLDLYPTDAAASKGLAAVFRVPAVVALYGPVPAATADGLAVFKTLVLGTIFIGVLGYVIVRRHTRTEEEAGRLELLGSGVVGRRAPLTAAVLLATAAITATSLLTVPGLIWIGMSAPGSIALACAWMSTGLAMIGITAVAAQLTSSTRGCAAITLGTLGVAYALRAIGDTAQASNPPGAARFLTWLSPVGWAEKVEPFGANRYAVVLLGVATLIAGVAVAYALLDRRDLGAGMLHARPGRPHASALLRSPLALAFRLSRGSMIGWTAGFVMFGVVLGSITGSVEAMLDDPKLADMMRAIGGNAGTLTDIFFAAELKEASVLAAGAGIAMMLRAHTEESAGRAEVLLATPVGRLRWLRSHTIVALLAPVWLLFVLGGITGALASGDAVPSAGAILGAALATVPACWVCVGVALLVIGLRPRWTPFLWGAYALAFVLAEFGVLLELPSWLIALSPFDHLQQLPGGTLEAGPLLWLTGVAAAAAGAGAFAFRRRDLQTQ